MKTSCFGSAGEWVGGGAHLISNRARGWEIHGDVRGRQVLPVLQHVNHCSHTRVVVVHGAQDM